MSTINEFYRRDVSFIRDYELSEGDLDTIEGLENVKRALIRRYLTVKGALVHRPEYGAGLPSYLNAPQTIETRRRIANDIQEQSLRDSRVQEVLGVAINFDDRKPFETIITVRVKLVGYGEEAIQFRPFGE